MWERRREKTILQVAKQVGIEIPTLCYKEGLSPFVKPYRAFRAEEVITGKTINEANAEAAESAAISKTKHLQHNGYMAQIARTMVKRSLHACCE